MKTKRKNDDERASGQERHVLLRQGMQYWWRRILPWSSCSLFALFIVASAGFAQKVPTNSETSQATKSQTVPGTGGYRRTSDGCLVPEDQWLNGRLRKACAARRNAVLVETNSSLVFLFLVCIGLSGFAQKVPTNSETSQATSQTVPGTRRTRCGFLSPRPLPDVGKPI